MIVAKRVSFDAAHFLPGYDGPCKNVHGHHWVVELGIEGLVKPDGMVIDFTHLSSFLKNNVHGVFDHGLINDIIPNPTAENIAMFIRERCGWVEVAGCRLVFIRVWETENSYVLLEG